MQTTLSRTRTNILGVNISTVNMASAVDALVKAANDHTKGYVCVTGVHGAIESQKDPALRAIHNNSLLTVPDGMPLVWVGRHQGNTTMGRVYGPDMLLNVLAAENGRFRHFFYGATSDTLQRLTSNLSSRFPQLQVVGTFAPPFRPLNMEERAALIKQVDERRPDFFWVGLSTPKQERFMAEYVPLLNTSVMLGVGAAFDIHAGLQDDAPTWIKRSGFQWLFRLCQNPSRLWRRYFHIVPAFLWLISLQLLGIRDFSKR